MSCKFFHEREGCIGCGACANIDPVNWEMNEDGKADLKDSKEIGKGQEKDFDEKDLDKNMETAECCPINVIHIRKDDEELI
jgi:ferredoxin|tara:strand:- start:337 stop:579 length:243 start_codon:yes stop_codon:yes gene_type:complete